MLVLYLEYNHNMLLSAEIYHFTNIPLIVICTNWVNFISFHIQNAEYVNIPYS